MGAQGGRKGAKREPKVMKKEVRRHLLEHAKTMAGTVREAYGEVPGRVQETLFAARGAKASPEWSRGGQRGFFMILGALWDSLGSSFCEKLGVFFALVFCTEKR